MKILILHANSDLAQTRRTSFNHAFCLLKYAPDHQYELQSIQDPVPPRLRREQFDAIILDTTFLCWRWVYPRDKCLGQATKRFAFVADSSAVKVALPQDEYDHSEMLDDWLSGWNVDLIYSVCYDHRHLFYPKSAKRAEIVEGLTGYIDDADILMAERFARPFADRTIDVGYRARNLPASFGRFGRLKAEIGERFLAEARNSGLNLDISLSPEGVLVDEDWLRFLGDSRFTLGCESGSSLRDPRGEIRAACEAYLASHPEASFEEIEAACFPGKDMVRVFSAISPRLFEAALAGSCQVLVPGSYLDLLKPDEHYIPLAADFSTFGDVLDEMCNWPRAMERIRACREVLLSNERLTYRGFVSDMLRRIDARRPCGVRSANVSLPQLTRAELSHKLARMVVCMAINRGRDLNEAETHITRALGVLFHRLLTGVLRRLLPKRLLRAVRRWAS